MNSVEVRSVDMHFRTTSGWLEALQDVSFEVGEHEFVSIIGPSGCGKSTMLRLVADLLTPTGGDLWVAGGSPAEARLNRRYAFLFQDAVMLPWRSVAANVRLPLEVRGERDDQAVTDCLKLVGLEGFEQSRPAQLSGGMRQRAAVARAFVTNPTLLLMDEPFGALDEITRTRMNEELLRIWSEARASVLLITHSLDEAVFLSDRVLVMTSRPGRIAADIEVPLPRPRSVGMEDDTDFQAIRSRVRKALYGNLAD